MGDDETTRSGLFLEAIRIIKEMREATNGVYPRYAIWENVPGAFSSNRLSAKACEGILRRAERRGKELPPMLKTALEQQSAE